MRRQISWMVGDDQIFGSWDSPTGDAKQNITALLIVSGGNEIRSGSHGGQSQIAKYMADRGYYVLRYDRRGVGDSEGPNLGFHESGQDIISAIKFIQDELGPDAHIVAFGNCDAASAILLNHDMLEINKIILANPWTIDNAAEKVGDTPQNEQSQPSAAAIRARYWAKIKNPRSILDLFTGKINVKKLLSGLRQASKHQELSALAIAMAEKLSQTSIPTQILIAEKDTTAMAFMAAYNSKAYHKVRANNNVQINSIDSASHSFSDTVSQTWLYEKLIERL